MDNTQIPETHTGQDELQAVQDFFQKHGTALAYMASLVLIVLIAFLGLKNYKNAKNRQSWEKLWNAKSAQDLEIIIEDHPESQAASWATLKTAKSYFDSEKYSLAIKKYAAFQKDFPNHPFADIAKMGELHCREALGQIKEALKGFTTFAAQNPEHYLAAQAMLGRARCLTHTGRKKEAKATYQEIITTHPETGWASKAEESLKTIDRVRQPAVSMTVPIPAGNQNEPAPTVAPSSGTDNSSNAAPLIDLSNFNVK